MIQLKLFIILIILIWKSIAIDVIIPDDGYELYEINKILEKYSVKYNNITIYINADRYSLTILREITILIPANTNVSIIGKPSSLSHTVFDYTVGFFNFNIIFVEYTAQTVTFENIEFYKFHNPRPTDITNIFYLSCIDVNFKIQFKNCVFIDSNTVILKLDINKHQYIGETTNSINFQSCIFR